MALLWLPQITNMWLGRISCVPTFAYSIQRKRRIGCFIRYASICYLNTTFLDHLCLELFWDRKFVVSFAFFIDPNWGFKVLCDLLAECQPTLYKHLYSLSVPINVIVVSWFTTLFIGRLSLEVQILALMKDARPTNRRNSHHSGC